MVDTEQTILRAAKTASLKKSLDTAGTKNLASTTGMSSSLPRRYRYRKKETLSRFLRRREAVFVTPLKTGFKTPTQIIIIAEKKRETPKKRATSFAKREKLTASPQPL